MLYTNDKIIKHKVGLLNLAEELGNVSKACKMMVDELKIVCEQCRKAESSLPQGQKPLLSHIGAI